MLAPRKKRKSEQILSNSLQTAVKFTRAGEFLPKQLLKRVVVRLKLNYERCVYYRLDISFSTLFWTLFGLITLVVLEIELRYVEGFGKLLFGLYNIAARILFLNMLIAMMSKSFNVTVVSQADCLVYRMAWLLCVRFSCYTAKLFDIRSVGLWPSVR